MNDGIVDDADLTPGMRCRFLALQLALQRETKSADTPRVLQMAKQFADFIADGKVEEAKETKK